MLKVLLKESAGWVVRCCGAGAISRVILHRRRVAILVYHDPDPTIFARHMTWMARRYQFIPIDTLVDAIETGDWSAVPSRALVITFDDGHRGNAALADLFQRFGIQPVIYMCSQIVDTQRHFWWQEAPTHAESLKTLDHTTFLQRLAETTGYRPDKEYDTRQALNVGELITLVPHVTPGAHTRFHPILPQCPDALALEEIQLSRLELEAMLKHPVEHFAYPNGDYGSRDSALVKETGYRSARTIHPGWNGPDADPFQLRAFSIEDNASLNVLALRLSGILIPLRTIRQWMQRCIRKNGAA